MLLKEDTPLPFGEPEHDHDHDEDDEDAPSYSRLRPIIHALQHANPRAAMVGAVGSGAMLISSPLEPLMALKASRRPHDGAAGLVGLAIGGGALGVAQFAEFGAMPLTAAFRIPDARPACALPW